MGLSISVEHALGRDCPIPGHHGSGQFKECTISISDKGRRLNQHNIRPRRNQEQSNKNTCLLDGRTAGGSRGAKAVGGGARGAA